MESKPKPLKDFLPQVMREMGVRPANKLDQVREAWKHVAGALAERARVAMLKNGVLTLAVESASLRYEIEAVRQPQFLPKLQALLPTRAVTKLKCVIG